MKKVFLFICMAALLLPLSSAAGTYTFTNDADWNAGTYTSTNSGPPGADHQVQLDPNILTPFNYIWVALSGRGAVARIDTNHVEADGVVTLADSAAGNGAVIGEYQSAPSGMGFNPSRTTTDLNGDVWVGNRAEYSGGQGSVVKITADPAGTSTSSGVWNGSTFDRLAWSNAGGADSGGGTSTAVDTAITQYVRTSGISVRAVAVDANNNVWVGGGPLGPTNYVHQLYDTNGTPVPGAGNTFDINRGGYGALVDSSGVLWSAGLYTNTLVRHNPATGVTTPVNNGLQSYGLGTGIGPDGKPKVWLATWTHNSVQRFDVATGALELTTGPLPSANGLRGVAVTPSDNNVWVASSYANRVLRLDNNGNFLAAIDVGRLPTGVAVDSNGKVWVTNHDSDSVMRIDPATNMVDLTIHLGSDANPYNYSDMTGTVVTGSTNPSGAWSYIADSGVLGEEWDRIFWNTEAEGVIPVDTTLDIMARAADTLIGLDSALWTSYASGASLGLMGRYMEVRADFTRVGGGVGAPTAILSDLSFSTKGGGGGAVIPEPSTFALLGIGLAGLGFAGRRRTRRMNG